MSKLSEAFAELCAVCRPRPDQDMATLEAAGRRLWKVLGEFAEPIALATVDLWPRRSEWFPTEKELRALLEEVQAEAARDAAMRGQMPSGRYRDPVGNTAALYDHVRKARGHAYCRSWLAPGISAQFTANIVFVPQNLVHRVRDDIGALAFEHGVQIHPCAEVSRMLRDYCDTNLGGNPLPKRRRA